MKGHDWVAKAELLLPFFCAQGRDKNPLHHIYFAFFGYCSGHKEWMQFDQNINWIISVLKTRFVIALLFVCGLCACCKGQTWKKNLVISSSKSSWQQSYLVDLSENHTANRIPTKYNTTTTAVQKPQEECIKQDDLKEVLWILKEQCTIKVCGCIIRNVGISPRSILKRNAISFIFYATQNATGFVGKKRTFFFLFWLINHLWTSIMLSNWQTTHLHIEWSWPRWNMHSEERKLRSLPSTNVLLSIFE